MVDVQSSTRKQTVLDDSIIAAIPASRGYGNLLATVPGIQATGLDVVAQALAGKPGARIVVLDGQVVHAGGVPDRKKVESWLAPAGGTGGCCGGCC